MESLISTILMSIYKVRDILLLLLQIYISDFRVIQHDLKIRVDPIHICVSCRTISVDSAPK
jgi:hypothetical protein